MKKIKVPAPPGQSRWLPPVPPPPGPTYPLKNYELELFFMKMFCEQKNEK